MSIDDHSVNVVLAFEDQDGREWLAAAIMSPLRLSGADEHCDVDDMPDRIFRLKTFKVVTAAIVRGDPGSRAVG